MKKTLFIGVALLIGLALATPSFAQGCSPKTRPEYDGYMAFFNEKVPATRATAAEKYLTDFKDVPIECKSAAHKSIVKAYYDAQNWAKALEAAGKTEAVLGAAPATDKLFCYFIGMQAGQQSGNAAKIEEFGDKVIALDPNGASGLQAYVAVSGVVGSKTDKASQDKASQQASKALEILPKAKPPELDAASWMKATEPLQSSAHGTLGLIAYNQGNFEKCVTEYTEVNKIDPKDWQPHYMIGLAYKAQLQTVSKDYQTAFDDEAKSIKDKADQIVIDEKKATTAALIEAVRTKREAAIEESSP